MANFYLLPIVQWFTNAGVILAGGKIQTYAAGTTTPLASYTDSTGATPNANPVVLDSAGRGQIWLSAASYKFVIQTSASVTLLTIDNYNPANINSTVAGLTDTSTFTMQQSTAATSGANQSSNQFIVQGNYWTGAASATDSWIIQDVLGAGSNPTSTLTITHSGSSGATAVNIPGNETIGGTLGVIGTLTGTIGTFSGALTGGSVNNIFRVSPSGDVGATINALVGLIGSGTPGVMEIPPFTTATASSLITLGKSHTLRIRGTGTLTCVGIRVPDSTTDTTAISNIECPEHAIIKLANSANVDVIANTNFLTLSGSGNTFGTFRFMLKGCQIDGNKANQTALVTSGTGTPSTVARTAGGIATIVMTGTPSPALTVGASCNVTGVTNDSSKFNGRFIAQAGTGGNTLVYFQDPASHSAVGSVGATGSGSVICYSGSNGVRLYGRSYWIEDSTISNNILDDLWTEGYTPVAFTDDTTQMEGTIKRVRTMNSGGNGHTFWGPQNSKIWDTVHFNHGQWGREIFQPMFDTDSVSFTNTSGSIHIVGCAIIQKGSQESSAAGFGILADAASGACIFEGAYAFCNNCTAIELRTAGHKFSGIIGASTAPNTIGVKFNGGSGSIDAFMANNTTYFDCTSISGEVMVKVWNNDAVGAVGAANCASGGDALGVIRTATVQSPTAGNRINHIPYTALYNAGNGFTPSFPASSGTLASITLAQDFSALQTFGSNKVFVAGSDFTTSNTTLTTITGLTFNLPAIARSYRFHCALAYSQATAAATNAFGIQAATNNPNNIFATGHVQITVGPPATFQDGVLATLATTTATNIVTFTPGATATNYLATLEGTIENPASANAINFMVLTGSGADAITVKRGSYCEIF